jgi:hypothetical protein
MLAITGLSACASLFGGPDVQVTPAENKAVLGNPQYDSLYESAKTAIGDRDYARALEYLQAARARDANNVPVLNALGVVYDKLGRFDLSTRYYTEARAADPESRIVAGNIAYSKLLQGLQNPELPRFFASAKQAPSIVPDLNPADAHAPKTEMAPAVALERLPAVPSSKESFPAPVGATKPAAVMVHPFAAPLGVEQPRSIAIETVKGSVAMPSVRPVMTSVAQKAVDAPAAQRTVFANATPVAPAETKSSAVAAQSIRTMMGMRPAILSATNGVSSTASAPRKFLTIGHPIKIVNAAGRSDRVGVVSRRLATLGWTVRQSDAVRIQQATTLSFPPQNKLAAQAMQHTLPFAVLLRPDLAAGASMQLVVGRDYLRWIPQNPHIAALWQKVTIVASIARPASKGVQ